MGLNDGLASLQNFTSQVSGAEIQGTSGLFTQLDGTTLGGTNITVIGSVTDADGRLRNTILGSAGTFGAFVQAGTTGPLLAGTGSAVFGRAFLTRNYIVTVSPIDPLNDGLGSTVPYTLSGITHATTGCTITGVSGTRYQWIAVGI